MSDERLIRIEDKVDAVNAHIASINVTLARQNEQLAYHIRRTDLLEAQMKPVSDHVATIRTLGKWLALAAAIAGIARLLM